MPPLRPPSAREIALEVLLGCGANVPVQALLDASLSGTELPPRDAALVTELCYGCLRTEIRLSWLLGLLLLAPDKLPPAMRCILLLASYELLHLSRIPDHASVDAAVSAVRQRWGKGLAAVANGTLRSLIRLRPELAESDFFRSRLAVLPQCLSVQYSLPLWVIRLWLDAYGAEQTRLLAGASGVSPRSCVRVNATKPGAALLRQRLLDSGGQPVGSWGVSFEPGKQPGELGALQREGLLSRQGAGSLVILESLQLETWESPVWDACAGRGGKTCALLERGLNVAVASDTSLRRLSGLPAEAARLGLRLPSLYLGSAARVPLDFTRASSLAPRTILLDVPCSGLGTLSRRPDLRRMRRPEDLPPLYGLQSAILRETWRSLAPGGRVVYLTCTLNPAENEHQISAFLAQHPDAELLTQHETAPDGTGADLMFGALIQKN